MSPMSKPSNNKHTMKTDLLLVGLDVHVQSITVAVAENDRNQPQLYGSIPNDLHATSAQRRRSPSLERLGAVGLLGERISRTQKKCEHKEKVDEWHEDQKRPRRMQAYVSNARNQNRAKKSNQKKDEKNNSATCKGDLCGG